MLVNYLKKVYSSGSDEGTLAFRAERTILVENDCLGIWRYIILAHDEAVFPLQAEYQPTFGIRLIVSGRGL